jgi:hypothetical protein
VATPADSGFYCPACRTAGKLAVFLAPVTDTTPGHVGDLDESPGQGPVAEFVLYRNGVRLGGGKDRVGGTFAVPSGRSTYRIHDTTDRTADGVRTSTKTSTDLTFTSGAKGGAGLPSGWHCAIGSGTNCTVLPLLRLTVALPTSRSDTLPVGATTFNFTIARIQGAAPARITAATLSTSIDGTTYHPAKVTPLGRGVFRATIVNGRSSAAQAVSMRVTGADAGGSTISQTVTDVYLVAAD